MVIDEILKEYTKLLLQARKFIPKAPSKEGLKAGIRASGQATREEEFVHPTPIMKNALIISGDVKQVLNPQTKEFETEKFPAGKESKAQAEICKILRAALNKEFGTEIHEYPKDLPFTDPTYYFVDCWNALDELEGKFWDITPDQRKQVAETMAKYSNPKTNLSGEEVLRLLKRDKILAKVLEIEYKMWPSTMASRDIKKISDPFMAKKSGVSYPDYHNDSTKVDSSDPNSITWGAYEIELAKEAYSKGLDYFFKWLLDMAVNTVYMRRQRGKGRALIALSRRTNLGINMVNGVEMENVKRSYYINTPFLDEDSILKELSETAELAERNGFLPVNIDSKQWDVNLGEGMIILQNAERMVLAQGEFTKQLIEVRNKVTTKSWVIDGISKRTYPIYGRMTSGSDDTTLGNTKANRTISTYGAVKTDLKYLSEIATPMKNRHVLTVGDDLLVVLRDREMINKFIDCVCDTFKIVIHKDEKFAIGVMFIQWRCFKLDGKYVMAYNVPRVVRSMCSKEDAKHLGRAGWTYAFWQQLSKLRRYPKALTIGVNIMAAYDQHHLSLDTPVDQLNEMLKEEDRLAAEKGIKETTAERMYKSNPNIAGLRVEDSKVVIDSSYFVQLQKEMKAVYDPNYLVKLGFKNPDLSKVK